MAGDAATGSPPRCRAQIVAIPVLARGTAAAVATAARDADDHLVEVPREGVRASGERCYASGSIAAGASCLISS